MPHWEVLAFLESVDRENAKEVLRLIDVTALGGGNLPKEDSKKIMRQWRDLAGILPKKKKRSSAKDIANFIGR